MPRYNAWLEDLWTAFAPEAASRSSPDCGLRNLLYMLFHYQIRPQTTRSHIFAGASFTAGPAVLMFARSVLNSFTILTATSCVVAHFSLKTEAQLSTTLNARQTEHELLPICMKSIELGPVKNNQLTTSSEASRDAFSAADQPKPHLTANLLLAVWIQFFGATLIFWRNFDFGATNEW